jgi:tRNA(fMet)-specific endonuclease VapC
LRDLQRFPWLSSTPGADAWYNQRRKQKVRVGTHDLQIAATCVAHGAILVTRNLRDFQGVPGLAVEVWA